MARKQKVALDGLEKFNRISNPTNVLFNLIFIIFSLTCIIPVLLVLAISITSEDAIQTSGYHLIPQAFSADGYLFLLKQGSMIARAFGVSLFVTVVGTVLGVLLTTTMGYAMSRPYYKLKGFLTWLVFIPMVFNGGLVSTYFVVGNLLGLKNTLGALILPLAVSSFNVIICKTFFKQTVPDSLIESAKIDGAGQFTIFFRIVLPISLPLLATIGLFLCFAYWNDWYQSMLYIDMAELKSLQAVLNDILTNISALQQQIATIGGTEAAEQVANLPQESARMAIVVIVVLPIACAYPYFQKYFISGLTVGAVKG